MLRPAFRKLSRLALSNHAAPAGLALLWASFFVGCIPIYLGAFPDEGDNLAIGLAITHGSVLFRDLFTHHFPLMYYWVAAALALLGPTILAARLSLLFLQLLVFALLMRITRSAIPVGLAAVAWSATRHLYLAHMALYNVLDGLALAVVFGLVLAVVAEPARSKTWVWVVVGAFSAMALLNDPLTAAPVGIGLIFLTFNGERWRGGLLAGGIIALALVGYGSYLALSGTWPDFYRDVVLFNTLVYSKYYDLSLHFYALQLDHALTTGLNLTFPSTWLSPDNYSPNTNLSLFGQWLFGGFLQRMALLAACVGLLFQRKWGAAAYAYLFAASLVPRTEVYFRETPLVLVSCLASASLLSLAWPPQWRLPGLQPSASSGPAVPVPPRAAPLARRLSAAGALGLVVWPIGLGLVILIQHLGAYGYATNFLVYKDLAAHLRTITCGRDVDLGYYPGDPTVYFFTGMRPVSKYEYLWPWVAEVAMPDVLTRLSQDEAVVQVLPVESVWGIPTSVYLASLNSYVTTHFVPVGQDYLSPQLAAQCPPPAAP